ncbi:MAG TPA: hypothetical protein VK184_20030 [Nostocaceae cyanobacterium]|nr:hypothetical protein [Nostocaceae cyanobacterium]
MEITTFELLVKRIAPPPAPADIARRVVQGYFLTITNLEPRTITYRITFHISRPNPFDADRTLFNNADLLIDIAGANSVIPLSGLLLSTTFRGTFQIPAKQTASVQLLPKPSLFLPLNLNPFPDFEVRGFVNLTVPVINGSTQGTRPVRVLLNPEIRGTFLPNDAPFPNSATRDFDQINYPLQLASGKGLNEILPNQLIIIPVNKIGETLNSEEFQSSLADVDELEKSQSLLQLMDQVNKDPKNVENLNNVLTQLDLPVRVSPIEV